MYLANYHMMVVTVEMAIIIHIHNIYVHRSFPEMHGFDTSNLAHLSNDNFGECHDVMNWKNLEWAGSEPTFSLLFIQITTNLEFY